MANLKRKLSSLMCEDVESNNGSVNEISIESIIPDENQPRKYFDERELDILAGSIKQYGVISPITVREENGKYIIVVGERRFRASKLVGLKTIPVVLLKNNDLVYETQLVENLHREDLDNDEIASGILYLIENKKYSKSEVAEKLSKSNGYVSNYYAYATMDKEVKDLLTDKCNDLTAILGINKFLEKYSDNRKIYNQIIIYIKYAKKITRQDVDFIEENIINKILYDLDDKYEDGIKNNDVLVEENEEKNKRVIKIADKPMLTLSSKFFKKVQYKPEFFEEIKNLILKYNN